MKQASFAVNYFGEGPGKIDDRDCPPPRHFRWGKPPKLPKKEPPPDPEFLALCTQYDVNNPAPA